MGVTKLLLGLLATALGTAAVGTVITIQQDPFAFTSGEPRQVESASNPQIAISPAFQATNAVFQLDDVRVTGDLSLEPPSPKVKAPAARPAPPVEPGDHTVPAPCVDGRYRLLEEGRGVRLLCPPES